MSIKNPINTSLGSSNVSAFPKVQQAKILEIIEALNNISATEGTILADIITEKTAGAGITIDGALIKDGSFIGKQTAATATVDGLTTGLITGGDQFVTVTSADANHIVALPLSTTISVGAVLRFYVGANGCELRYNATDAGVGTITLNNVSGAVEAAIPANTFFTATYVTADKWLLTAVTDLGAVLTAIIPDGV